MNNAIILLITLLSTATIVGLFFYYMVLIKKRDAKTIGSDWKGFQNAVRHDRVEAIREYGERLIWNEHITVEQVKEMSNVINRLEKNHPELNDLKLIIYNKRKDWSKRYPRHFTGSPF